MTVVVRLSGTEDENVIDVRYGTGATSQSYMCCSVSCLHCWYLLVVVVVVVVAAAAAVVVVAVVVPLVVLVVLVAVVAVVVVIVVRGVVLWAKQTVN
ncbi:hypothetical protein ElyMa_004770900 [Elysia marginata]|uniref:ABC transmembrane type-1 domain-containing protein n=1 Tax=Elysia marginata TaxID=1093978 RepID=A0AAV4IE31_9GAST|nr:hypothetical protein ElyMa_004770900 [Elysia marginata]